MTTKKLATIAAALLISVAPAAAIINQPVHTVQAATQLQKGKVTLKKSFNGTVQVFNSKGNAHYHYPKSQWQEDDCCFND